jgi:hypothetical protein
MRFLLFALSAAFATVGSLGVQVAKEPLRLKPSSKWHLDHAKERCRLAREFGDGEDKVTALLDKYGPGETFRLTLAGHPVRTNRDEGEAQLQFGPTEPSQQQLFFTANVGEEKALVFAGNMRIAPLTAAEKAAFEAKKFHEVVDLVPVDPAREAAVRYLEIGRPLHRTVILETGPLRAPFAALHACTDQLVEHWGLNAGKHKSLTRKVMPATNPGPWISSSDYPSSMLAAGQPASVEFRLDVGIDGKPTACYIQSTTGPKAFDDAVCKAMIQRAEFTPALDADGKPLPSYWRSTVRFYIP